MKLATETSGIAVTIGHTTSEVTIADNLTVTGTVTLADGSLALADLDIDGGTDIGAAIVDADLFIIDDGAGGTNRKVTASRVKTYCSGTHVKISQSDFSTSTDVSFTSIEQSTYNNYLVKIDGLYASATGVSLYARIYTSAGEITASNYDYAIREYRSDGTESSTQGVDAAFMRLNHRGLDDDSANTYFGNIYIGGVKSGERCQFFGNHGHSSNDTGNPSVGGFSSGHYTADTEITGFKFYPDGNNITGTITLYGIIT